MFPMLWGLTMSLINLSELNLNIDQDAKPVWSVTLGDYRYILYSTNKALVFKGENKEPSYEITPVGCSCPGDRYSSNACKHRKAISYLGDGSAAPPVEGTPVRTKQVMDDINNYSLPFDDLFE